LPTKCKRHLLAPPICIEPFCRNCSITWGGERGERHNRIKNIEGHSTELQAYCPSFAFCSHPLAKTSSQPLAVSASDSAQAMQKRWEYVGHKSWVPGKNIPALVKGGAQGGHSLNAAGLQFFGNCVTNVGKVSPELRQRLYMELSGRRTVAVVDAVTLVSALGGVSSTPDRPEAWRRRRPERLPPAIRCHLL